jgi:hypothetical protein
MKQDTFLKRVFWKREPELKLIHMITRTAGYLSILAALLAGVVFYTQSAVDTHGAQVGRVGAGGHNLKGISNLVGAWAVVLGVAAVAIWVTRKIYIQVKKRQWPDFDLTKSTMLYLRRHHILLGWATLVTVSAHGIYYLLQYPNKQTQIVTGLIAWGALVVLVALGLLLDFKIQSKQKSRRVRVSHFALAAFFIIGMLIHLML